MEHYGIRNVANTWFQNYLDSREQFVTINGTESDRKKIVCGVPQDSLMGPLLFLIFINDVPNASEFSTLLFVDDTTFQISGMNTDHLFQMANSELENLLSGLDLSATCKCKFWDKFFKEFSPSKKLEKPCSSVCLSLI